jgi:hypothetical protein
MDVSVDYIVNPYLSVCINVGFLDMIQKKYILTLTNWEFSPFVGDKCSITLGLKYTIPRASQSIKSRKKSA